ncbi:hypothetical protein AU361_26250 (plasmid) [Klebsiella pneumoniae]|nr:hypothetical protein AU361_26250 [Klebsiella pneumoniae]
MSFLIGLFAPVLSQRRCPFNSLLLPMAAAQLVLMLHRGHQVDKHTIDGGYHASGFTAGRAGLQHVTAP